MGLDITIWAERRTDAGWEACYRPTAGPRRPRLIYFYPQDTRDRQLFAILGGAWWDGCETSGYQFYPIQLPRGLPDDSLYLNAMPPERRDDLAALAADFNATWYTLRELLDFPWHEKKRRSRGYVNGEEYAHYLVEGREYTLGPLYAAFRRAETHSGEFSLGGIFEPPKQKRVSNAEMQRLLDEGAATYDVWTKIDWKERESYAEHAGVFLNETLPLLGELGEPEDVRVVMVFY
jgi:hypothetical protein